MRKRSDNKIITAIITILLISVFNFLKNIHCTKQWNKFFVSTFPLILLLIVSYFICNQNEYCGLSLGFISIIIYILYWNANLSVNVARLNEQYWQQRQWWWRLDGWQFEQEVANIFKLKGYYATVTKGSGDGGVDIILEKDGLRYIVQCKHYKKPVQPEPIRALWGVKNDFHADGVILVASSGITEMGAKFVQGKPNFQVLNLDDIIVLSQEIVNTCKR